MRTPHRLYKGVPVTQQEEAVLMTLHNAGGPNLQIHADTPADPARCVIASYITGIQVRAVPRQVRSSLENKRLIIHNPGNLSKGVGWYWLAKEEGEQ